MTEGSTSAYIFANAGGTGSSDPLAANPTYGNLLAGTITNSVASWLPSPTGSFNFFFDHNQMKDLWMAITWGKG